MAAYTLAAPEEGDLAFEAGARILVVKKESDWWTGMVDGRTGIFPESYVQPATDTSAPPPAAQQVEMDFKCVGMDLACGARQCSEVILCR